MTRADNQTGPKPVRRRERARRHCRLALGVLALLAVMGCRPLGAQSCVQLADSVYRQQKDVRRVDNKSVVVRVPRLTLRTPCTQWASDSSAQFMETFDRYHRRSTWELYIGSTAGIVAFAFMTQKRYPPAAALSASPMCRI